VINITIPFYTIIILMSAIFMLINPRETVQAASQGLVLWYSVVFPALFPFFIVAELLVKIRFVNFMGIIMEPIMRPLFRLPGCSALVLVLGFTCGFPVGAVLTRKLYDQQQLTADEAERLLSFTNNASPLFILGAVGIGMLGNPQAGYLLAFAHYLSNFLLGILWRFRAAPSNKRRRVNPANLKTACQAMLPAADESVGIANLLGDAIRNSLNNVMAVGGFIIVFSVLTRMLSWWGFIDVMAAFLLQFLQLLNLNYPQVYGLCMGIFEMTLGAKTTIANASGSSLAGLMVISAILAFSGLSIIAQVMSIMAGTPVRLSFYLISRIVQLVLACVITLLAYRLALFYGIASLGVQAIPFHKVLYSFDAWTWALKSMLVAFFIIFVMLLSSLCRKR